MYAIVRTGGKQYKVQKDDVIRVEKMDGAKKGDKITLDDILLFSDGKTSKMGEKAAKVTAEVIAEDRDKKVIIFKKRRRQNSRRKNGHRQHKTVLKITDIKAA